MPGLANTGASFYTSHVEPDLNDEPHIYRERRTARDCATIEGYTARCVGGGTQLYGGVSLRFTPADFRLGTFNAGPHRPAQRSQRRRPPRGARLADQLRRARAVLLPRPSSWSASTARAHNQAKPFSERRTTSRRWRRTRSASSPRVGMDALGMKPYRTPLAVITEDHAPSGRKVGPLGSRLDAAKDRVRQPLRRSAGLQVEHLGLAAPPDLPAKPNFELRPNCVVTHLESSAAACLTRPLPRPERPAQHGDRARWSSWRARRSSRCGC